MELVNGILKGKVEHNVKIGEQWLGILYKGIEQITPARNDGRVFINRSKEFPI